MKFDILLFLEKTGENSIFIKIEQE